MSGRSATWRSYDHSSTPCGQRRGEDERAAALETADLGERPVGRVAREPVEQRRLVDLQRRDAVVQLVRGEEEREVLEAAHVVRPALDVAEPHARRVAQHRGVDQVLADAGAAEPADEVLDAVGHGGERYCKRPHVRPRVAQARRAPDAEHGDVRDEPDRGRRDRPDDEARQARRQRPRRAPQTTRGERNAARSGHDRTEPARAARRARAPS